MRQDETLKRLGFTTEIRRIVLFPDGLLAAYFLQKTNGILNRLVAVTSKDNGLTWSEPVTLRILPTDQGYWYGWDALATDDGEAHVFTLNDSGTGVAGSVIGEGDKNSRDLLGARLDIWHIRSSGNRTEWSEPRRIWQGYTGSLNSAIQMRSGRILLAFSYATHRDWFHRSPGLDNFTFHGSFACGVLYSDDEGTTWQPSRSELQVWVPEPTNAYGACEPVVLELSDGRVWMVIRTQTGRLYESFSVDGADWSVPRPMTVWSSDSPVGLVRLTDGRIVMIWNCCLRYPYAFGGRHVLHAAISEDEGRTWIGVRECARDPKRLTPPPNVSGDFGTGYPYPVVTADNHVIFSTGQGEGRVQMVRMKPSWLCETDAATSFDDDDEWQMFGTAGASIVPHPERPGINVLRLTKVQPCPTAAAVWNFPCGARGELSMRFRMEKDADRLRVSLTDHFSVPFDAEDHLWSLFNIYLDNSTADDRQWHTLRLLWDVSGDRVCHALLDEKEFAVEPLRHESRGACYVRLALVPNNPGNVDTKGLWVENVSVRVDGRTAVDSTGT